MRDVIVATANAYRADLRNSCVEHGGNNVWLFRLVNALRQRDSRWGLNWKRGNRGDMSQDVVNYNFGSGPDEDSTNVYIIDTIGGHCGNNPGPNWEDVTQKTRDGGTIGLALLPEIEDGDVEAAVAQGIQRVLAVLQPVDGIAGPSQRFLQALAEQGVVFDQQEAHAGSVVGAVDTVIASRR